MRWRIIGCAGVVGAARRQCSGEREGIRTPVRRGQYTTEPVNMTVPNGMNSLRRETPAADVLLWGLL